MGYLHQGHLSLIKKSNEISDVTVVSIFVNPKQFAPGEDLNNYPRDVERDSNMLINEAVDYLFFPSSNEIYPDNFQTFVSVEHITKILEGEFRPSHFRGVTTVVNILFNSVMPDYAFFGQKDAQQAAVIKQMVRDLKIPVEIVLCPIIREVDGLAMSSRNVYLSENERKDALVRYNSLKLGRQKIIDGEKRVSFVLSEMIDLINEVASAQLDYVKIVESDTFRFIDELEP